MVRPARRRAWEVADLARLALGVSYARPAAAARWLVGAFGFTSPDPLSSPWGLPFYAVGDPGSNRWAFVQARPTVR